MRPRPASAFKQAVAHKEKPTPLVDDGLLPCKVEVKRTAPSGLPRLPRKARLPFLFRSCLASTMPATACRSSRARSLPHLAKHVCRSSSAALEFPTLEASRGLFKQAVARQEQANPHKADDGHRVAWKLGRGLGST